ncbi:MAG: fumarylacetoacetate hydrolase family protein [Rhizobiales bacterium]|mgnify:CR=1 FL=1|nr:fumarylacetoacetate hydrolase family protein [Hyphomicrobiales bacterium]
MDHDAVTRAAALLAAARSGPLAGRLPEDLRPKTAADAYAIQSATVARLGEEIAGWKVATMPGFGFCKAILMRSRVFRGGDAIPARLMPMLGIEAEIAFRFDRPLPPRAAAYAREEVAAAVTAFPAIEVIDTRFSDYEATPAIERAADFMSNGGFVIGPDRADWRSFDLAKLEASVIVNGKVAARQVGGHAAGDAFLPAIDLANDLRSAGGIEAGMVVTTGTFTGITLVKPGDRVEVAFIGFGSVTVQFAA